MSRKLNSLSALLAFAILVVAESSAVSQVARSATQGRSNDKFAVVATKQDGNLRLAGGKDKVIGAMQRALNSGEQPGKVTDVAINTYERASYLAVQIDGQGTLYLQLVSSGGGIQEIFHIGDLNSLYCSGCKNCNLVPASLSQNSGPRCECPKNQGQGSSTDCKLFPRRNIAQLTQLLNGELLAVGFEEVGGGSSTSETPQLTNGTKRSAEISPRTNPIKRPNN